MKTVIFYIAIVFTGFVLLYLVWEIFTLSSVAILLCLVYLFFAMPLLAEHKYFEKPRKEFLEWLDKN